MNNKIDWVSKLTSRKFWLAVIGFVTPLLIAFGVSESKTTEVASIIMAGASLIAYILGEGLIDASRASANSVKTNTNIQIKGEKVEE